MNNSPIGIFDSGVGGLSVLFACMKLLPRERFVYIFDRAHAPYGDKSGRYIKKCALDRCSDLLASGCKAIVIACNTATATAIGYVRSNIQIPVIGTYPPVRQAAKALTDGRLLVLMTQATARRRNFSALEKKYGSDRIIAAPQKLLATKIEENFQELEKIRPYVYSVLDGYENVQSVAIGCTHYSFIKRMIADYYDGKVSIFDPAEEVAEKLRLLLNKRQLAAENQTGQVKFYFT